MADFLVECMVADAQLLSQYGAPQRAIALEGMLRTSSEGSNVLVTQKEIRRQRNREWMQRSRQQQRESVTRMKTTMETLRQYLDVALETQRFYNSPWAERVLSLENEKRQLQQWLLQHMTSRQRLADIVASYQQSMHPIDEDASVFFPEYKAITLAQAQTAISLCFQDITGFGQSAKPLAHWTSDARGSSCTFGWKVTCDLRPDSYIFLSMTKRLDNVSAKQAMEQSWAVISKPYASDKSPSQRLSRSMLLQELDNTTSVIGTDWHHPLKRGVCMRSITVRNCGAREDGQYLSLATLNPQDPELRRHAPHGVEYMDKLTWHDYIDEANGCVVTLKTLSHYDTHENLHLKFVNALSSAWRWEIEITKYPMKMLEL